MAYTPLSPSGVASALQNVAKFPDSRLQQYAAGRPPQPTGQVQPGPTGQAAQELNTRGIQRQAAQRQQAMQNDPANSPTIFQQKDMELQQKAQQIQQKEQQLGLLGALMAKKAQDMQARDTAGIGSLPLDTFNKFDGGIVFSGGGAVQRFNGLQGSQPRNRAEANLNDLLAQVELLPDRESLLAEGMFGEKPDAYVLRRKLQERGYTVDPKTNKIKQLEEKGGVSGTGARPLTKEERATTEFIQKQMQANPSFFRTFLENRMGAPAPQQSNAGPEYQPVSTPDKTPSSASSNKTNTSSVGTNVDIEGRMRRGLASVRGESDEQKRLVGDIQRNLNEQYKAIDESNLTDAQKEVARKKVTDAMQAEYGEYTKGREARQKAVADALRGEKPGMFAGIASALPTGRASLADVLAGAAKGVTAERSRYRDAGKEAALYMARAQEESARADMLEKRGQRAEAQAAEDRAQALLDKATTRRLQGLGVKKEGIAALLQREDAQQATERAIAEKAVTAQLDYDTKVQLERLKASLQPKEVSFYNQLLAAFNSGDPKRIEAAKDMLSAMSLRSPASNTGELTDAVLMRAYTKEKSDFIKANFGKPYTKTFQQFKQEQLNKGGAGNSDDVDLTNVKSSTR